jgi:importin subunit beta-1
VTRLRNRQSTLETLGYICEEMAAIHDDVLSQEEINAVLTAVVQVIWLIADDLPPVIRLLLCMSAGSTTRAPAAGFRLTHGVAHVQGMQKNEQDNDVRLAATTALFNALEFAHSNFNNDSERNYLMQASTMLKSICGWPCAEGLNCVGAVITTLMSMLTTASR